MELFINEKKISQNENRVYLIAEAGVNHGGDIELAKEMVKRAAQAGADAIKFQTYKAEKLASKNSPAYWDQNKEKSNSQYELFKKYDSFEQKEYRILSEYCKSNNIEFLSTPFDSESAHYLNEMMPLFKIASADITNHPFLTQIARYNKPVILSTGASSLGEIDEAIRIIEGEGNHQLALLHCILSYPTKDSDANLNMITHLQKVYPQYVIGYSDHTIPDPSMVTLSTAVHLGARIIEKHFTLDKTKEGNDHYHAMDDSDIRTFRENLQIYTKVLGNCFKEPVEAERDAIKYARRSLVAKRDIVKGEIFTEDMLTWKRPGTGISPKDLEIIIGCKAQKNIREDEILTWEIIKS